MRNTDPMLDTKCACGHTLGAHRIDNTCSGTFGTDAAEAHFACECDCFRSPFLPRVEVVLYGPDTLPIDPVQPEPN